MLTEFKDLDLPMLQLNIICIHIFFLNDLDCDCLLGLDVDCRFDKPKLALT